MQDKCYTPEQLETLKQRRKALGEEEVRQAEANWQNLIAEIQDAIKQESDPKSELAQQLTRRWLVLVQAFTGDDAAIEQSLQTMYQQEAPEAASQGALDVATIAYISRAIQSLPALDEE